MRMSGNQVLFITLSADAWLHLCLSVATLLAFLAIAWCGCVRTLGSGVSAGWWFRGSLLLVVRCAYFAVQGADGVLTSAYPASEFAINGKPCPSPSFLCSCSLRLHLSVSQCRLNYVQATHVNGGSIWKLFASNSCQCMKHLKV